MKKTLFLSALLGAVFAAPSMADVTYGGTIYTYTPGTANAYLHSGTFTKTTIDDEGNFVVGTETTGWQNAASGDRNNTLRFVSGGSQTSAVIQFTSLTLGGIVVEEGASIKSIVNENNRNYYIGSNGTAKSGSTINDDFLIKTTNGSVNLRGVQEIDIANGKTLTLQGSSGINITGNVTVAGAGTLKLNSATTLSKTLTNNGKIAGADAGTVITISNDVDGFTHTYGSLSDGANGYYTSADVTVMTGNGTTEGISFKFNGQNVTLNDEGHFTATFTSGKYFINSGTVTHSAGNGATAYEMKAGTTLIFAESANTTLAITTTGEGHTNRYIQVNEGADVTVASINNSWGMKAITLNGNLKVTGTLSLAYPFKADSPDSNKVTGSGSLTAATLVSGNWGHYLVDVNALTATTLNVNTFSELTIGSATAVATTVNLAGGSKLSISSATTKLDTVNVTGASTLNLLGASTSITSKLYVNGKGVINIGDATHNAVVTAKRLELGDVQGAGNTSTLNLAAGSVLKVTDSDYTGDKLPYKNNPIVFGEWEAETTANIDGTLIAAGASIQPGDKGFTLNIGETGVVAVKGIGTWGCLSSDTTKAQKQAINLNGGLLVLGENGFNGSHNTALTLNLNGGTLASTQAAPTITVPATLGEGTTTTLSSTAYIVNAETNSVTAGTTASNLTVSGVISGAGALKVTGAGIVTLSGTNTYTGGTTIADGTLKMSNASALGTSGDVAVQDGGVLDATGVYLANNAAGNWNGLKALNDRTTTSGTGYINLGSGEITMQTASVITLTNAYKSTGLTFNGQNYSNGIDSQTMSVGTGGSLTVANDAHNAVLSLVSGAIMNIQGGAVTADSLNLGHENGHSTDGKNTQYFAQIALSEGSLTTGAITLSTSIGNALTMTGGTLTVTGEKLFASDTTGALATLSLTGGTLAATDNSWTINRAGTIGGVTISTGVEKSITIGANVTLSGAITNNGDLVFADGISATAAAGTFAVKSKAGSLTHGTSGFVVTKDDYITVVTNGANGSLTSNNVTVTQGDDTFTLGNNGEAHGEKQVDYSTYMLNGSNSASVSDMKTESGDAVNTVAMAGSGELLVDADITNVTVTSHDASAYIDGGSITNLTMAESAALAIDSETKVALSTLTLGSGASVTVNDHAGTIELTTLVVEGNSDINANLVVTDGGTISFDTDAVLTMGCGVEIGDGVTVVIDADLVPLIQSGTAVTIIDGIDTDPTLTLGSGWKFVGTYGEDLKGFGLALKAETDGDNTWRIVVAPEPATTTLSLLALAALCARRRRH